MVGAGIIGTAVAVRLAGAGLDVCVLDRAAPAAGASSAGEGNLLVSDKLPGPELELALRSLELWHQLGGTARRSIELQRKGGLVVAWDEVALAGLKSLAEAQRAHGVAVEILPAEDVGRAEPMLSPRLAGGAFYPDDCQVQPMLTVALQARELLVKGGKLVRGAEVLGCRRSPSGWITELSTSAGAISVGSWVINAAGAWAGGLARLLGGYVDVEPRKGHVLVTEPLPELVRHKVYDAGYVGSIHEEAAQRAYASVIESTPGNTMLIGSSREFVGFASQVQPEAVAELARRAVALVPGLAGARLMRAYTGFRPATPDRLPVIGADQVVPNLLHATGHEGAGILLSQVTAELVESLVLGRDPPLNMDPFSPGRFSPGRALPPPIAAKPAHRLAPIANAHDYSTPAPAPPPLAHFTFDGRRLAAPQPTTVAGALVRNGERAWRLTRRNNLPRGLFCGIGNCFDCLVDLRGHGVEDKAVRACLAPLRDGCQLTTSQSLGGSANIPAGAIPGLSSEADLAVVGAGPAGMAAATAAASRGARVVLVDSGARLGGQYFRQPLAGPHLPGRWRHLESSPLLKLLLGVDVWSASNDEGSFVLRLTPQVNASGAGTTVRSRALVLATGASELTLPFPGWELPGVVTAGAAQSLLKSQGLPIGRRVVVAGTGPFLLPVAAALVEAGVAVTAVEAFPLRAAPRAVPALLSHPHKLAEAARYASVLARHGVRFLAGRAVVRAEGAGKVERVSVARLGRGWVPVDGPGEVLEADALCVSHGFVPRLELARQLGAREVADPRKPATRVAWGPGMVASVPGLFVAGEVAGVAGAEVAELEGELAGHSAASYLGFADDRPGSDLQLQARRLATARSFARRLEALYPLSDGWLGWLEDKTVFCRCEETTWGAVRAAVEEGAATVREVRNVTRCGMGYCQGRTCGPLLQLAVSALSGGRLEEVGDLHKRPVAVPVPLGQVARG